MNAVFYLIFMTFTVADFTNGPPLSVRVDEFPNLRTCERVAEAMVRMAKTAKWSCIEGVQ